MNFTTKRNRLAAVKFKFPKKFFIAGTVSALIAVVASFFLLFSMALFGSLASIEEDDVLFY